mmetsp:Transcript_113348/g.259938  ORF Transcript_113348/g.259938 Transcript_113348/m.259938 type:complete len:269 (-) Transcript_113348:474-1280(-)
MLTVERFELLAKTAEEAKSFRSFRRVLSAFQSAALNLAPAVAPVAGPRPERKKLGTSKLNKLRAQGKDIPKMGGAAEEAKAPEEDRGRGAFDIQDSTTYDAVVRWGLAKIPELLNFHVTRKWKPDGTTISTTDVRGSYSEDVNIELDVSKVTQYQPHIRLGTGFFRDAVAVMRAATDPQLLTLGAKSLGSFGMLRWAWKAPKWRKLAIKMFCELWCTAGSQQVRLASYVFLRNSGVMFLRGPRLPPSLLLIAHAGQRSRCFIRAARQS